MREGHSPASGVADLLVNAGWFGYESVAPQSNAASTASGAASSSTAISPRKETTFRPDKKGWVRNEDNEKAFVTKAKYDKQWERNEELTKQLKAAKSGAGRAPPQQQYDRRRDPEERDDWRNQRQRR